ncbi:MAG: endonuclease/exonuclease/phosphatase family protein [Thermoanaerobaculum sp.]
MWSRRDGTGLFLQDPNPDQDPATSEGLFVFTRTTPQVAVGEVVRVRGQVQEYVPSADPSSPPLTELVSPQLVRLGQPQPLPEPVVLSHEVLRPDGGWEQLERFEGMRVAVASLQVVGPTLGKVQETEAMATSTGVVFGVLEGVPRPFREPGFPPFDPLPAGNPPPFDGNPEILRVDTTCLLGGQPLNVSAGSLVGNLVGPLSFASRRYTLCPEPGWSVLQQPPEPSPPPAPALGELAVASWNLQRFYDAQDDPGLSEPVLTPQGWELRLSKLTGTVADFLRFPHVLIFQEVESVEVLQALASRLEEAARENAGEAPNYQVILAPERDPGGLRLGALVSRSLRKIRLTVQEASSVLTESVLSNPDGTDEPLFDRPPLLLRLTVKPVCGRSQELAVVGVHLRSMNGLLSTAQAGHGWANEGARVRAKRAQQAEALARWVDGFQKQNPTTPLVVLGDFNAFEFSDGVVDVVGTVAGTPASADAVVVPTQDLVEQDLVVLTQQEAPGQRYSYVYDGSAQALDHVLISQGLVRWGWRLFRPRLAADFPEVMRNQEGAFRLSDHDPLLLCLQLPRSPRRLLRAR